MRVEYLALVEPKLSSEVFNVKIEEIQKNIASIIARQSEIFDN